MTPQERELLTPFLQQMTQAQAGQKDAEADALIRDAFARQPDAAYLLVQRAMGLDYALQATQAQAAKLQAELDQLHAGTRSGFLDTGTAWGRSAPAPAQLAPARAAQAPAQPLQAAVQPAPAAAASSWGSGMLGSVATTAAGVVAGAFLFQGIQGLMGHHGAGLGDQAGAGGGNAANLTPLAPEAADAPGDVDSAGSDDAGDYAAIDDGNADSGDSA
jgi:hypothetical protein